MYLCQNEDERNEVLHLPDSVCWLLAAEMDGKGNACIYLHVYGREYSLCCSNGLTETYPGLTGYDVLDFYDTIVGEVFREIRKNGDACIDLEQIQKQLLPEFLAEWQREGYILNETPPAHPILNQPHP